MVPCASFALDNRSIPRSCRSSAIQARSIPDDHQDRHQSHPQGPRLLAKTTVNGCTPGEAASALSLASTIVSKHGLNPADFIWPEPPAGWRWEGVRGHGGTVVEVPAAPEGTRATKAMAEVKPRRERKPKTPAELKAKGPTRKEQIIEMLRSPGGTTIDAIVARFGVQRHSARAAASVFGREIGGVSYDKETKIYRATAA